MSSISRLIEQLCPEGVPFLPLGSVGEWFGGGTPSKVRLEYWENGTIPWLSPKDMGAPIIDSTQDYITEAAVKGSSTKLVPADSVAIVVRSSILDRILPTALIPVPIALNQDMKAIVPGTELLPKYLAHVLRSRGQEILRFARKRGGSVASIDSTKLFSFPIPVPPIAVQQEIIRVLDKFAHLEAELESELTARRRQYDLYRDSLITFDKPEVPHLPLGKLARILRGASPRPIQAFQTDDENGVPWIKIGDVNAQGKYITATAERITQKGSEKSRRVYPGDFVLSNSMSFGRPYLSKIEGCIHDGWLAISDFNESFIPDFLYHLLRSSTVQAEFARRAGSGTVQNLNADIVKAVVVPVPSMEEQKEVALLLDKFDLLVNDLSVGLPAELNARRKQHEHYRDRLLTFEEAAI